MGYHDRPMIVRAERKKTTAWTGRKGDLFKVKRLGKLCAWRCGCSVVVPFIESESSSTLRMPSPFFAVSAKLRFTAPRIATCSCAWLSSQFSNYGIQQPQGTML